jgi:hypothetical protein
VDDEEDDDEWTRTSGSGSGTKRIKNKLPGSQAPRLTGSQEGWQHDPNTGPARAGQLMTSSSLIVQSVVWYGCSCLTTTRRDLGPRRSVALLLAGVLVVWVTWSDVDNADNAQLIVAIYSM